MESGKLDKTDLRIIRKIAEDSRQPLSSLARAANVSVDTVKNRLDAMRRAGIISRLFAEPDLAALSLRTFRLYVDVSAMPEQEAARLMRTYRQHPACQWVARGEGAWDFILRFSLPSERDFKQEVEEFMNKFGRFVKRKAITLGTYQAYFPPTYLIGGTRTAAITLDHSRKPAQLDLLDYRILEALYEDARLPNTQMAHRFGVTPEVIQYRLKGLRRQGVIHSYSAWFNPEPAGFHLYKVFFWLQNLKKGQEKTLIRHLESVPNSGYLVRVLGEWDLEVDLYVQNPGQLQHIITDVEKRFPGIVRDHATMTVLENDVGNPLRQFLQTQEKDTDAIKESD